MHPDALPLLACPACPGHSLRLIGEHLAEGRIDAGALHCPACESDYPILRGIPRFVASPLEGWRALSPDSLTQAKTARNFGEAWRLAAQRGRSDQNPPGQVKQMHPLHAADLADKVVLEAGSGLGKHLDHVAGFRPRQLIGLELSPAIDESAWLLARHPGLTLVQGNLLTAPFQPESFDWVYSLGVLQHLDNPQAGFEALLPLIRDDGRVFVQILSCENTKCIRVGLAPFRQLASWLPVSATHHGLAWPLTGFLTALSKTLYSPSSPVGRKLPYREPMSDLAQYDWDDIWTTVTEQLVAPKTSYLSRKILRNWLLAADWAVESFASSNGVAWQVLAQRRRYPDSYGNALDDVALSIVGPIMSKPGIVPSPLVGEG